MNSVRAGLFVALLLAITVSAIAVVWARQQNRLLFVQLSHLQTKRDALNVDFGRLELERTTWGDPVRIERIARDKLGMSEPDDKHRWMIAP